MIIMSSARINYLLKKYDKHYVGGEKHSPETNKMLKRNQRRLVKHAICEDLFFECDFFSLSRYQRDFVHFLIDRFSDHFKKLHGKAKNEAIIIAFIFYVMKLENSRINVDNYSVCKKYGLSSDVFVLIVCRMCDDFVKKSPINFYESTRYDHDILSKNGGKL